MDFTVRFFSKINRKAPNGCWEWTGNRNRDGYGLSAKRIGTVLAHRISYRIHRGVFDLNLCVLHKCDNPPCVNPDHLFLGTDMDNMRDMHSKGRNFTPFKKSIWCKKGHEFTEESTYIKPNGKRTCRLCDNDRRQAIRAKKGLTKISNKLKTHCNKGHEFTPVNTFIEANGGRRCKECKKIKQQNIRKKMR